MEHERKERIDMYNKILDEAEKNSIFKNAIRKARQYGFEINLTSLDYDEFVATYRANTAGIGTIDIRADKSYGSKTINRVQINGSSWGGSIDNARDEYEKIQHAIDIAKQLEYALDGNSGVKFNSHDQRQENLKGIDRNLKKHK